MQHDFCSNNFPFAKNFMFNFQIYLDMAVLVDAQGEILDNIENQVFIPTNVYTLLYS